MDSVIIQAKFLLIRCLKTTEPVRASQKQTQAEKFKDYRKQVVSSSQVCREQAANLGQPPSRSEGVAIPVPPPVRFAHGEADPKVVGWVGVINHLLYGHPAIANPPKRQAN